MIRGAGDGAAAHVLLSRERLHAAGRLLGVELPFKNLEERKQLAAVLLRCDVEVCIVLHMCGEKTFHETAQKKYGCHCGFAFPALEWHGVDLQAKEFIFFAIIKVGDERR